MKRIFLLITFALCLFISALIPTLRAYDDDDEEFSPWAAWRNGFKYFEKGERDREKGKHGEALEAYRKAYQQYYSVKKARPNWNQQVIGTRIKMCQREINKLNKLIGTPSNTKIEIDYDQGKAASEELQRVKAELITYKKKLFTALMQNTELQQRNKQNKNNHEQIEDLMREKRIFTEEYKLLQKKYTKQKNEKRKPSLNEQRLKTQLVDTKIKNDIIAQRLKLQQEKEKELNEEIAVLYRYKTKNKNSIKEFNKVIENYKYKLGKNAEQQNANAKIHQKVFSKAKSLETHNKQIAANLKEKEEEIKKLDDWLKQLRKKSGNQSDIQQEIIKANQLATKKYQDLKKVNEKNVRELQEMKSLLEGNNLAEEQLKKTLQAINSQRGSVEKEYSMLHKSYEQLLIIRKANSKEMKMLREKKVKADSLVKSYSEKYKWIKKKLAERSDSDLNNISSLNKKVRSLNREIKKREVLSKELKSELYSSKNKYKKLETSFDALGKMNINLKASGKLLAQEAQSSQIVKQENDKLRKTNEAIKVSSAKAIAGKRKEYRENIKKSEEKLLALQKQNQNIADKNNDLNLAVSKLSKLHEELQDAQKTIKILRDFGKKKTALNAKHLASLTKYTPQIKVNQTYDLKQLLADGIKAEKDDSEDLAIWNYRKYLSSKPDNAEVSHRLGSILNRRGQIKEAAELLKKAYSKEPDNVNNAAVYAQILIKEKKYPEASIILQKAIKKYPDNYKLLTEYASAQAGAGKTTKALDNLDAAIKLSPQAPQAYLARAQIVAIYYPDLLDSATKSYRKARKFGAKPDVFLEEVLAKNLEDKSGNSAMVEFLLKPAKEAERDKDWVSAAWYFGQLHKLKPENQDYRNKLSAALFLQKDFKKSLSTLDLDNLSNNGNLIAASIELRTGRYSRAEEYLKEAKKASSMKVYFQAIKEYFKTINAPNQKRFKKIFNELNKRL